MGLCLEIARVLCYGFWDQIQFKKLLLGKSQRNFRKTKKWRWNRSEPLYTKILFVHFILCNEEKKNLYYEIFSTPSVYIFVGLLNSQIGLNKVLNTQIVLFLHCLTLLFLTPQNSRKSLYHG